MNFYGELYRFLFVLVFIEGVRIVEILVNYYVCCYGKSKYGLGWIFWVVMDLLMVFFMKKFFIRFMYIFGMLGLVFGGLGLVFGIYLIILKFGFGENIGDCFLLILVVVLLLVGL